MPHGVCHFEDSLLGQQGLHLIPRNDVALLQGLDGEIFTSVLVPEHQDRLLNDQFDEESWILDLESRKLAHLARITLPKWPLPRTATKWKLSRPMPASDRMGRDGRWV